MQNNQIKIMANDLVRVRVEGENQYKDLVDQLSKVRCKTANFIVGAEKFFSDPQDTYVIQQSAHDQSGQNSLAMKEEFMNDAQESDFRKCLAQKNVEHSRKLGQAQIFSKTVAVNDTYYFDYIQSQQGSYDMSREKMQDYTPHLHDEHFQLTGDKEISSHTNNFGTPGELLDQQADYLVDGAYHEDNQLSGSYPYKVVQKNKN